MRVLPVVLAGIYFGVVALASGASEERTFKDTEGREIVAKILSGTGATVTIEMAGGKIYDLPVEKFSAPDQEFINDWIIANPQIRLSMTDDRKRTNRSERRGKNTDIIDEDWCFNLKLKNGSGADVNGLEVKYRIFKSIALGGKDKEERLETVDGSLPVGLVGDKREVELLTNTVTITKTSLDSGYYYDDGSKGDLADTLEGIWVKVFYNGVNVFEYQSGTTVVKKSAWSDEKALAGG